jgi:alkanesulfonate monooxygenase SsuD/methylene tetrahydromethanopterin reductase-like flavin-dependent oxidoreductase (luciferase family)
MAGLREFRFATTSFEPTREGVLRQARMAERLGYGTFHAADHLYNP